jgi:exodeoxyribonuclease V alpha subunit
MIAQEPATWTPEDRDYTAEQQISGKVTRLFCEYPDFTAGILRADSGPVLNCDCRFSIKGKVEVNQKITASGKWTDGKFGKQFVIESLIYSAPELTSAAGLAEYLQNMDGADGIGPVKAKLIAEAFEIADFDSILRNEPERVALVAKVSVEKILSLQSAWTESRDINAVSVWLASYGLTPGQIRKIAKQYGNRAEEVLRDNPYELHKNIDGIGFLRNDEIALKMGVEKSDLHRIQAGIRFLVDKDADDSGHTYIPREELVKNVVKSLYLDALDARALVSAEIYHLIDQGVLVSVTQDNVEYVGSQWLYEMEMALLAMLTDERKRPEAVAVVDGVVDVVSSLTLEQGGALDMALSRPISIITGGAGTGKSYTISRIVAALQEANLTTAICTPTGKAARRLQSDGVFAQTIHRTLGIDPMTGAFAHNEDNCLDADCVIVDEVSMCAVPLLYSLCKAIAHARCRLILVGDYNQLPPIGPGNTLRDMVDNDLVPVTRLTQCHRNAGQLKTNCGAILQGNVARQSVLVPEEISADLAAKNVPAWSMITDCEDTERLVGLLRILQSEQFARWGFDPLTDCQIITPQNPGVLGVNRLNLELQRVEQAKRNVFLPPVTDHKMRPKLLIGDKVMETRNDPKTGLMNGCQGVILDIAEEENPANPLALKRYYIIQFDDRNDSLRLEVGADESKNLVLAYAVTAHKTQGSQYPCIVAVIHKTHSYMLSQGLFYTAVTRARFSAIILGEPTGISRAARTRSDSQRRTWTSLQCLAKTPAKEV